VKILPRFFGTGFLLSWKLVQAATAHFFIHDREVVR